MTLFPSTRTPTAEGADTTTRGIGCALLAVSLFAIQNALVKTLAADFSAVEIVFFRHLFGLLPVLYFLWRAGGTALATTAQPVRHVLRGLIGVAATTGVFYAFGRLELPEATAIGFATPLFITALSVPLLGEQVGWRRWSAVAVGFGGVLVVLRPGAGVFDPAAGIIVLSCLGFALTLIMSRRMSRREHTATIVLYFTLVSLAVSAAVLPFVWTTPGLGEFVLFAMVGLLGGSGYLLVTQAYRWAPAAVVAPFDYTHILWAIGFGFALWGTLPGWNVALGAAIVIASGLYILHRETVRGGAGAARHKIHPRP